MVDEDREDAEEKITCEKKEGEEERLLKNKKK